MGTREDAIDAMRDYFRDERLIAHTLKVLSAAESIADGEGLPAGFTRQAAVIASIFHDIGIPEARRRHGSDAAPWQEQEGPPAARPLLAAIGVRPDILERVCFIVGAHHTREQVDGPDFQAVWEADFIVNVEEKNLIFREGEIGGAIEKNTSTPTGRRLAAEAANRIGLA